MNTLEDRLREAYRAAAETVRPETVLPGGPGLPSDHRRPAARSRRAQARVLIPVAAAAAVTAVALAASSLAQPGKTPARHRSPASRTATAGRASTPAYFVALSWMSHPYMTVVNAATGTALRRVSLPFPAGQLQAAATGDGRTFVVAAGQTGSCGSTLYRFTLSASGTPTALKRFATLPASVASPWAMAVSGNGQKIAYLWDGCGPRSLGPATLNVLDTTTGKTKRWTFDDSLKEPGGNLSMSPDGSEVGLQAWVLRTSAPPGPLAKYGQRVYHQGEFGRSVIMGGLNVADGHTVYFSTLPTRSGKPAGTNWQLRTFDLATGNTSLLRNIRGTPGTANAAVPDPTGRYLLITAVPSLVHMGWNVYRLNVATGHLTQLKSSWAVEPSITW